MFLDKAGDDVDGQSDNHDIEEESQNTVGEHLAPQLVVFDYTSETWKVMPTINEKYMKSQ